MEKECNNFGANAFLKHFAIIGTGTFFNMLLGLLATPIITRVVSPYEYGQFSLFLLYAGIAVMVLCLGMDQTLARYYYIEKESEYRRGLLKKCLLFPSMFTGAFLISLLTFFYVNPLGLEVEILLVTLFCVEVIVLVALRFGQLVLRLENKSGIYSFTSILRKAIYILLILLFLNKGEDYLIVLVSATIVADGVCVVACVVTNHDVWEISRGRNICISTKELVRYGCPYVVTLGVTTLFQGIDRISLERYCTYTEVGIYSSAATLVNVFAIIQTAFNTIWAPMAIKRYSEEPEDKEFHANGYRMISFIMFTLGVSLIFGRNFLVIMLGEKYREAAYVLPCLVFSPIMYTISETTVGGLVFMKKSNYQMIVAIVSCLTNIIGNICLVPIWGCKGAAISTAISYVVFFSMRTIFSIRFYYINYELKRFYLLTFFVGVYALYSTFGYARVASIMGYIFLMGLIAFWYKKELNICLCYLKKQFMERSL